MSFASAARRPVAKVFTETFVRELQDVYATRRNQLLSILRRSNSTDFAKFRANELLRQVKAETIALDKAAATWAKKRMPKSYRMGQVIADKRLAELRVVKGLDYGSLIHVQAVNVLVDSVTADLLAANQSIKRTLQTYIRRTQQTLIEDREISRMIAKGVVQGQTRKQTSDVILRTLDSAIQDGRMLIINGRHYDPASYARLVARTRTREAATQGTINSCLQYDVDLVQVSAQDHLGDDAICPAYAGRVYSISGTSDKFKTLDRRPPFHANCRHLLLPLTEEGIDALEDPEALVALSNDSKVKVESFDDFKEAIAP